MTEGAALVDRSESGKLALSGPRSGTLVGDVPDAEHSNAPGEVGGAPVLLIRTSDGVDLVCDSADTDRVRAALTEAGAVQVGEEQAEVLRVERGRPRYGV